VGDNLGVGNPNQIGEPYRVESADVRLVSGRGVASSATELELGLMNEVPSSNQVPEYLAPEPERVWGMMCHLTSLSGLFVPFGSIIGPLIVWLIKKDEMPFADDQGRESLSFQVSWLIWGAILVVLCFVPVVNCLTIVILAVSGILWLVFVIMATVHAQSGKPWRYPVTIRMF
jgi:hypothetical protein